MISISKNNIIRSVSVFQSPLWEKIINSKTTQKFRLKNVFEMVNLFLKKKSPTVQGWLVKKVGLIYFFFLVAAREKFKFSLSSLFFNDPFSLPSKSSLVHIWMKNERWTEDSQIDRFHSSISSSSHFRVVKFMEF